MSQILIMHQRDKSDSIDHLLFDNDPNSAKSYQNAPIYTASLIGNPKLFEVVMSQCGISHSVILGRKQKREFILPDDTVIQHFVTPLSLIQSKPENHNLIDVLVKLAKFNDHQVTSVNLSDTRLSSLSIKLFRLDVYKLNLQNNELSSLPLANASRGYWPNRLQELNVSYNLLESLPKELFDLPCLETLNVSHNPMKLLPEKWRNAKSLKVLDVSYTSLENLSLNIDNEFVLQTMESAATLPNSAKVKPVHGKRSTAIADPITSKVVKTDSLLKCLNASYCKIAAFPKLLAYFFPKLEILNISNNKLKSCCAINELPISLQELDISNNLLRYSKNKVFLIDIRLSEKSACMEHKELRLLNALRLSNNASLGSLTICEKEMNTNHSFFPNLRRLYISNCNLKQAPEGLVDLQDLTELDISNNVQLKIPHEICNLERLFSLNYNGVKDPIVNEMEMFDNIQDKLIMLQQEQLV